MAKVPTKPDAASLFVRWCNAGSRTEERKLEGELATTFAARYAAPRVPPLHMEAEILALRRRQDDYLAKSHSISSS